MGELEELLETYWLLVQGALIGQVIFIIMWLILPWWREWVGRALMFKSFAIGLILSVQVWFHYHPTLDMIFMAKVGIACFALVFLGVWAQVIAIAHEIYLGCRAKRLVRKRAASIDSYCK